MSLRWWNRPLAASLVNTFLIAGLMAGCDNGTGDDSDDAGSDSDVGHTPAIVVNPTQGLQTTELGGTAGFVVVLATPPTADVSVPLVSSDETEGVVEPSNLVFTPLNWNAPQEVRITGQDDDAVDGNVSYTIVVGAGVSADSDYDGLEAYDVSLVNVDNETAGVTVQPTAGLTTTEAGGQATFTVVLNSQPSARVTIPVVSSNVAEGDVGVPVLVFTTENWNAPQIVTITGVDDDVADGNQDYTIELQAATSDDSDYNGIDADDVSVSNSDNETAGITVSAADGLRTTEAGGQAEFSVVLNSEPTGDVVIGVSVSDPSEGSVAISELTFTALDWDAPQFVTVTGVNDDLADGGQVYQVVLAAAVSTDTNYNGMDADDVTITNTDDDSPGVTVTPIMGLVTTEGGGQDSFTIVLNSEPSNNVTMSIASSDTTEGTVSLASVMFTPDNWNAPVVVTVTGVDDAVEDGSQPYVIQIGAAVSNDSDYAGINPVDVGVSNTDNDTAGITIDEGDGVVTTEAGGEDTFTIVLNSRPTSNVTIDLSSSDTTEATVAPAQVIFTSENWNSPRTITVTGVDDAVADRNQTFSIVTAPAVSMDANYAGMDAADVTGSNTDDDSAGITVAPTTGLEVSEAGDQDSFTVVLNSRPTDTVMIAVASSDATEGMVSTNTLTFTVDNWSSPQSVTVTGLDDLVADGAQPFTVTLAAAVSNDTDYSGLDAADVSVSNIDNDSAGISISPNAALVVGESGAQAVFSLVLNSRPTASVTIAVVSTDTTEATVSPASVTFTVDNWNAPQDITVTGQDDFVADGDQNFLVETQPATSADPNYNGLDAANVLIRNIDDDSAGVTVTPTTGLSTSESGGDDTFTVVLNSRPTANVTIDVSSSDATEGTVAPTTLLFTPSNWNAPQIVTVTGVDDASADGNQPFTVQTRAAVSADPGYDGLSVSNVSVTNVDDDSAGITVTPTSGLTTTEAGGTASFTVVLNSQPGAAVTIPVSSNNPAEGTVSTALLSFTVNNWNAPQTVTVTGVNDDVQDGNQLYDVALGAASSADGDYHGIDPADVEVSNTDNDSAGITVMPTTGLVTTEAGGTASFTVVLNSEPASDVTIAVSSSNTSEGTVSTGSLAFTPANWNAPQTVTVTGVGDVVFDGDQPYTIVLAAAMSMDANYNGLNPTDVSVVNDDNDPGVRVTPTSGLSVTEAGSTATFTVVLNVAPSHDVIVSLTSNDPGEGTVSPGSLTFTSANWNAPRTVTVTGVNDDVADGDQVYTIVTGFTSSTDLSYNGLTVADVTVTTVDDESAGFTVSKASVQTTEEGGSDTFTIVLNSEPTADVTVGLLSSDTTEGTVSPASLTFTSANWSSPRLVTVTGANDDVADGNQVYTIVTEAAISMDSSYNGLNPADVSASNLDNETAGITVTPTSVVIREDGTSNANFSVRLNSQPLQDVEVPLSSSDTTEGTVSPASLTFTSANWNAFQTVTISAVDDAVADGDQPFTVRTEAAVSMDSGYNGLNANDVSVLNIDDDSAGVTVVPPATAVTTEAGGFTTFTIVLNSQPTNDVRIDLSSSDSSEGTVNPASLTFTSANWSAPQVVTVTGVDDLVADGSQIYTVITSAALSSDGNYNGLTVADVNITNTDDETAGFEVTPTSGLVVDEAGGTDTFAMRLSSQPTANVTVVLRSSDPDEATVSPAFLVFTAANWNAFQTVTVTGVDDVIIDGDQSVTIVTDPGSSADGNYDGLDPANVSVTNGDDETAGVEVSPTSGLQTTEEGGDATFSVVLTSQPTADVTVALSSGNPGEGTVNPASVTFTSVNWNAPQQVTVTGVDDAVADGNQVYTIVTGDAVSMDSDYSGLVVSDVTVTNVDDETAGIAVTPTSGLVTNEAGTVTATFRVRLTSEPTANVVLDLASDNTAEGTPDQSQLTFTAMDWNVEQTVTVTGANDDVADGNQSYTVSFDPATSMDMNYAGMTASTVSLTNLDDETAGITVTPTLGLVTSENGTTAQFSVVLNSEPTAAVSIAFSYNATEGSLSDMSLSFDAMNWNTPQVVTITGVDDMLADGNQLYLVTGNPSMSADPDYASLSPFTVQVMNVDND